MSPISEILDFVLKQHFYDLVKKPFIPRKQPRALNDYIFIILYYYINIISIY